MVPFGSNSAFKNSVSIISSLNEILQLSSIFCFFSLIVTDESAGILSPVTIKTLFPSRSLYLCCRQSASSTVSESVFFIKIGSVLSKESVFVSVIRFSSSDETMFSISLDASEISFHVSFLLSSCALLIAVPGRMMVCYSLLPRLP